MRIEYTCYFYHKTIPLSFKLRMNLQEMITKEECSCCRNIFG